MRKVLRHIRHFFTRLRKFIPFASGKANGVNLYLDAVDSLLELENTGTILIDHKAPGIVVSIEYFTLWNKSYVRYRDDRVLHAWCDKARAVINMRRGRRSSIDNSSRSSVVTPSTPLLITVVEPSDYSIPCIVGYETEKEVKFKLAKVPSREEIFSDMVK